jgi:hypothetical protein
MIRSEIFTAFRAECPEITERVVGDSLLAVWAKLGDKLVCALTRCIVSDFTFNSVATSSVYSTRYDLTTEESKFYDIDENPGGGVSFNDVPLDKTTVSELDAEDYSWRKRSAGTPEKWYRRGKYLYFDYPVATAALEIRVYAVLVSDDFDNDNITPYNQLSFLEPFHWAIVLYLIWMAKKKVGKPEDALKAENDFNAYCVFMRKTIGGNKYGPIRIQPTSGYVPQN